MISSSLFPPSFFFLHLSFDPWWPSLPYLLFHSSSPPTSAVRPECQLGSGFLRPASPLPVYLFSPHKTSSPSLSNTLLRSHEMNVPLKVCSRTFYCDVSTTEPTRVSRHVTTSILPDFTPVSTLFVNEPMFIGLGTATTCSWLQVVNSGWRSGTTVDWSKHVGRLGMFL